MKIKVFGYIILALLLLPSLCKSEEESNKKVTRVKLNKKRTQHLIDTINRNTNKLGIEKGVEANFQATKKNGKFCGDTELNELNASGGAEAKVGLGGGIANAKISASVVKFTREDSEFLKDIKIVGVEFGTEIGAGLGGGTVMAGAEIIVVEVEMIGVKTKLGFSIDGGFSAGPGGIEAKIGGLGVKLGKVTGISTPFGEVMIDIERFVDLFKGNGCKENEEQSGLLCYPKCRSGFTGVGPVCWQDCPNSFRNDGAFCFKPKPYGRGVGYVTRKKCEKKHDDCEKYGLLWYPECKEDYHNFGCCICSPNCPDGMTDIGISCAKKSYGRGFGKPRGRRDEL